MSSVLDREDAENAEAVRAWIAAQPVGSLRARDVRVRREEDSSGELAWFFDLVLPDPDPRPGTWPVDDLIALDLALREEALRRNLSWPWHLTFVPETDEPQEDEDALPDPG